MSDRVPRRRSPIRRVTFVVLAAGALSILLAGEAVATVCVNVSKRDGAGNIGDVIVDASTGAELSIPTNAGGQLAGGYVDVWVDFDGSLATTGDRLKVLDDTFILDVKRRLRAGLPLPELPQGAHQAAGCGQAVDDAADCSP